eukprot:GGOE01019244.1.p1 GENE.GGOE01019244.1~~GGOE01019244.1.p1  ORF type:complete len:324 (-),score=56.41 GGOE01019244.1:150-1076(-)
MANAMLCVEVKAAKKTHPTGDPSFAVMQAFPAAFSAEMADPFLMCDEFGPMPSHGRVRDPDDFPIGWHPHCGMDIVTYIVQGVGRHGDSLGNREEFSGPGLQWMSVGSGVEHAEGGGTPAGQTEHGFQIWINVPSNRKRDDPQYGTEGSDSLPVWSPSTGVEVRVVAGTVGPHKGPFRTVQPVQLLDVFRLPAGMELAHEVPPELDSCLVYVYRGVALVAGKEVRAQHVALLDAADSACRQLVIRGGSDGAAALIFAGKRLRQPIAWHGPFVMTTQAEIREVLAQHQRGTFPPKRVAWDYQRLSAKPV